MAERETPEESAATQTNSKNIAVDDALEPSPPAPPESIDENGFAAKALHENEDEQGNEEREQSEKRQSETTNGIAEAQPQYPPPGRAIRIRESAPNAPPLPRIHEGTRAEDDTREA